MKRVAAVLLMAIGLGIGGVLFASVASAQSCPVPDIADFTDPVTGDIDYDAYTAALACPTDTVAPPGPHAALQGIHLARTGSNTEGLVLAGVLLICAGGVVVAANRSREKADEPV